VPVIATRVPGWHVVHCAHAAAFEIVLNAPSAQTSHAWSATALPFVATNSPATQVVHGTQAVALFPSSSQVPFAQVVFGASPPGQCVPGSQAAHSAGDVGVAAFVCTVPASHAPAGKQVD
jgi:hypothetical protein